MPAASRVTLWLYGEVGELTVAETVSGRTGEVPGAAESVQNFEIDRNGQLSIDGPGGQTWDIEAIADNAPGIEVAGEVERGVDGEMRQPFKVVDDYGVMAGHAQMVLDLEAVDRRFGLTLAPEKREAIVLDLPMTITGSRTGFEETLIENLSQHPWATLPVQLTLLAKDTPGQSGISGPETIILPGRRFFDPLAGAIVEQRRDLLWNRDNSPRVAQVLRAVSYRPDDIFRSATAYLKLRVALRRLELFTVYDLTAEQRDEIAQVLWDIAVLIEDGNLANARERLQEAMRNGATSKEIVELMQELRDAMQGYMRQQAEQQQQDGQQQADKQNMQEITGNQLQQLMDRLQELMEQGRMGEAMARQQQGKGMRQAGNRQRDPLDQEPGANGQIGTDEQMLLGDDIYRRARELLDEIRRRSGDRTRPRQELDYLKRLLERF